MIPVSPIPAKEFQDRTDAQLELYLAVMKEIKTRIYSIDKFLRWGRSGRIDARGAEEFCYLQLRMICELIALGCLAVHNDIPLSDRGKLLTKWSVKDIIKPLENLHNSFFPKPGKLQLDDRGVPTHIESITDDHLTKDGLLELYWRCGDLFHRGVFTELRHRASKRPVDLNVVANWTDKIVNLLLNHHISLVKSGYVLCIELEPPEPGRVRSMLVEIATAQ